MSNDTQTDGYTLLDETVDLISNTTVFGVLYTFSFSLYCLSTRLFYRQSRGADGKLGRRTGFMFALASIMMVCATIDIIISNLYAQIVYIDLGGLSSGLDTETHLQVLVSADYIVTVIVTALLLGILLWRVWIVWSGTRFTMPITIFSLFLYLAATGTYISYISITWFRSYSSTPAPEVDRIQIVTVALLAASVSFMTATIVIRLMIVRRQHIKIIGKSETAAQYLGISAMLVESFSPNAIWLFGLLACVVSGNKGAALLFFDNSVLQIEIVSYFLIVYRVFLGRAWNKETRNRLSTLQFDHGVIQPSEVTTGTVSVMRNGTQEDSPEGISLV